MVEKEDGNKIWKYMQHEDFTDLLYEPEKFIVNNFIGKLHFKSFCETGEHEDLIELLKVLENHELYEYCAIVRDVINEKS